jgi:hypothetical protein
MRLQLMLANEGRDVAQVIHGQHPAGLRVFKAEQTGACEMEIVRFDEAGHLPEIQGAVIPEI